MKLAHAKFVGTAITSAACFITATAITIHMIWFNSKASEVVEHARSGARRMEASRASRQVTYQDLPAIMFLCIAALALGIIAIRFYNHAKSEFEN